MVHRCRLPSISVRSKPSRPHPRLNVPDGHPENTHPAPEASPGFASNRSGETPMISSTPPCIETLPYVIIPSG